MGSDIVVVVQAGDNRSRGQDLNKSRAITEVAAAWTLFTLGGAENFKFGLCVMFRDWFGKNSSGGNLIYLLWFWIYTCTLDKIAKVEKKA